MARGLAADGAGGILAAAGRGRRMGGKPKALLPIAGRTLLEWGLDALAATPQVGQVVVAAPEDHLAQVRELLAGYEKVTAIVSGGEERQNSVAAALEALEACDWVVVHDAARPLATPALITRVLKGAEETGAAIAAIPARDTLKVVENGRVQRTVDREGVWLVQTPQAFRHDLLREAHARARAERIQVTDDAALVEALGIPVRVVEGDARNLKVTVPQDVEVVEALLRRGESQDDRRVGLGYDTHRLVQSRRLVLGGVGIPSPRGLAGHSDGDALLHAIMDALLGAAGLPDIGHHFPPGDARFKDADSLDLLGRVRAIVANAGFVPVNVDTVVLAEAPLLAPYVGRMRSAIAAALGLDVQSIGVKATTTEGLGAIGRGEGIAAQAVATIRRVAANRVAGRDAARKDTNAP